MTRFAPTLKRLRPATGTPAMLLQRTCAACGNHKPAGGKCAACDKQDHLLQRRPVSPGSEGLHDGGQAPPIVHEILRESGQPLDASARAFFEPRFGHDFSGVRVHADAPARRSPWIIGTRADRRRAKENQPIAVGHTKIDVGAQARAPVSVSDGRSPSDQSPPADRRAPQSERKREDDPPKDDCPIESAEFTSIPSGTLEPTLEPKINPDRFTVLFPMSANFSTKPSCTCARGVYRQFVRGTKTMDGEPVALSPGSSLTKFRMHEDKDDLGVYGDRSLPPESSNQYLPDQEGGCEFSGWDAPGIRAYDEAGEPAPLPRGVELKINLHFRAVLEDSGNHRTLASARWAVKGTAVVPGKKKKPYGKEPK